mmetsp:Transcript_89492/g.168599  ORF Transcript_89492/g.168599 Transcript_89492/m.168599 type:complete len:224 (+) Transcript_89492:623-1294(+)
MWPRTSIVCSFFIVPDKAAIYTGKSGFEARRTKALLQRARRGPYSGALIGTKVKVVMFTLTGFVYPFVDPAVNSILGGTGEAGLKFRIGSTGVEADLQPPAPVRKILLECVVWLLLKLTHDKVEGILSCDRLANPTANCTRIPCQESPGNLVCVQDVRSQRAFYFASQLLARIEGQTATHVILPLPVHRLTIRFVRKRLIHLRTALLQDINRASNGHALTCGI